MARLSALQVGEFALHAAAFLAGLICASALTVTQGRFGGQCILYGSVAYNGTTLTLSTASHASLCYFVSFVSILAAIVSFSVLLFGVYSCCVGDGHSDRVWAKGSLGLSSSSLFLLLVSACLLRVGMDAFCASVQKSLAAPSCQEAQHRPWVPPYRADSFYDNLYTAEAAAWVNFFFWCLLTFLLIMEYINKSSPRPLGGSGLMRRDERAPIIGDGQAGP